MDLGTVNGIPLGFTDVDELPVAENIYLYIGSIR
jgi:hypothetical protein